MKSRNIGLISAITYAGISAVIAGTFLVITLLGDYSWVARGGGTAWVFLLSLIISMPLVISYYKKKYGA